MLMYVRLLAVKYILEINKSAGHSDKGSKGARLWKVIKKRKKEIVIDWVLGMGCKRRVSLSEVSNTVSRRTGS
jgi:hypothetical protein